ncbi:M56 family metallopeptidase [uncultured Muribaculum sp.]|uniref:M56 family metallopeptidase n=1 Tax=uncultured Muribaculum sp. TaxID=1918613 RepID=UPI00272CD426|nr:M56 family metallopeptidase [uncultured Muribaculum sp.]
MNAILLYLLEVNIIVTVVYLAYRLLLSRDTHFQWRRAFMLAGVTVAVVFPLVDFGVTAEKVGGRVAYVGPALQVVHGAVSNVVDNVAIDVQSLLVALYVSVAAVLLLYLVVRVVSVFALVSRYDDMTVADRKLFVMPGNSGAFSFFGFIFVSEGFIDDDNVISHEAVHVDQLHSVDVLMSEFLSILCWFNPVAWLLRGEMRDNLEYIADSRVMTRDNRRQYQMSLLAMTDNQAIAKFYNNFNVSSLKKRIKIISVH